MGGFFFLCVLYQSCLVVVAVTFLDISINAHTFLCPSLLFSIVRVIVIVILLFKEA